MVKIFFLLLFSNVSFGASFITLDISDSINNSKNIITGFVTDKNIKWNAKGNLIITEYNFQIEQQLLGRINDSTIVIPMPGGTIGD
ncbi:MAG: hypothetical protein HQL46_11570, partial [Gammaproteobacteria bacterium]|nr:hypothetical protein [Gammaproteobacteria bacterium]